MTNNLALVPAAAPLLPSPSNFEAYARAVQQWPMLDEAEEKRLIQQWRDHGSREAARELVASHLRLVVRVVRDHRGYGLPEGDLAQEGTVGLMRAVHKFDPSVGVRLAAYALRWIEAEIKEFIFRNWRLVKLGGTSAMKKLFFGYRHTMASLRELHVDRAAGVTPEEVAQAMGLSEAQVRQARAYFSGRDLALESPGPEGSDGPSDALMLEALPANQDTPEVLAEEENRQQAVHRLVHQAMARLPERDRAILTARKMLSPPQGLAELGVQWGVSAERVRQIENKAAAALAKELKALGAVQLLA